MSYKEREVKIVRILREVERIRRIESVIVFRWFKSTDHSDIFEVTKLGIKWLDAHGVDYDVVGEKELDLDETREFYDPHPGLAGAMIPLPKDVKKVADGMDGQLLSLREAIRKIQQVTKGSIELPEGYDFIGLRIGGEGLTHSWRVICYRDTGD